MKKEIYVVVYTDPYTHGDCDECCGQGMNMVVEGVFSTAEKALKYITDKCNKTKCYKRIDFDIERHILGKTK